MSSAITLLDSYKKATSIASDNACAAALGVTRATVSGWRVGKSHPDADSVARMCAATGQSIAHWLPLIEADRARNPEARKVWLRLAQAAACLAITTWITSIPSNAYAAVSSIGTEASQSHVYTLCAIADDGCDAWARVVTHLTLSPSQSPDYRDPVSAEAENAALPAITFSNQQCDP